MMLFVLGYYCNAHRNSPQSVISASLQKINTTQVFYFACLNIKLIVAAQRIRRAGAGRLLYSKDSCLNKPTETIAG